MGMAASMDGGEGFGPGGGGRQHLEVGEGCDTSEHVSFANPIKFEETQQMGAKETVAPSAAEKLRKETTVLMDDTIWKELPEELLENVIARVPVATSVRFRLVCHKWNSLPFLQRPAPQELPLIYAVVWDDMTEKSGALYDHSVQKWSHKSGALYDHSVQKWYYISHAPPYYHWDGPRCDSGGLVCYADFRNASFRVGNHLTRTNWKVFPWCARLTTWGFALGFVYNPSEAGGYKIVWLQRGGLYGVHDYSSEEEKTTITVGRIPDDFELPCPMGYKGISIGDVVYFRCYKPEGIMSYDVVSGTWEQLLIAYPPNSHILSLAEGKGRLLLVGWVDCNKNNIAANAVGIRPCVCFWELDSQIHSWIEVDRMPPSYCSEFENNTDVLVACLSTRRLLVFSLSGQLLKQRTTGRLKEIVAYDVVSREWSKVPECIPPGRLCPQEVAYGISFFPCLSVSP